MFWIEDLLIAWFPSSTHNAPVECIIGHAIRRPIKDIRDSECTSQGRVSSLSDIELNKRTPTDDEERSWIQVESPCVYVWSTSSASRDASMNNAALEGVMCRVPPRFISLVAIALWNQIAQAGMVRMYYVRKNFSPSKLLFQSVVFHRSVVVLRRILPTIVDKCRRGS